MSEVSAFGLVIALIFVILGLPISISEIVIGSLKWTCNHEDPMNLSPNDVMLANGIISLFFVIFTSINIILIAKNIENISKMILFVINIIFFGLLSICFFIITAIVLFRSNIECIKNGSPFIIYQLVLWCISAFIILKNCCANKSNDSQN